MADNALKTPVVQSLETWSEKKIKDAVQLQGKALPCSVIEVQGSIVVVKFEVNSDFTLPSVRMPIAGSEYIRLPIQVGCKGVVVPIDSYLGGISGLGGGIADLTQRANLSTLFFVPMGNIGFSAQDGQVLVMYGPNGVTMMDQSETVRWDLSPTGVNLNLGGGVLHISNGTVIIDDELFANGGIFTEGGSGTTLQIDGNISATGDIIAGTISLKEHEHDAPGGGGTTSPPIP